MARNKTHFMMIRVSPDELIRWQKASKRAGMTLSAWVRRQLNNACGEPEKRERTEAAA